MEGLCVARAGCAVAEGRVGCARWRVVVRASRAGAWEAMVRDGWNAVDERKRGDHSKMRVSKQGGGPPRRFVINS